MAFIEDMAAMLLVEGGLVAIGEPPLVMEAELGLEVVANLIGMLLRLCDLKWWWCGGDECCCCCTCCCCCCCCRYSARFAPAGMRLNLWPAAVAEDVAVDCDRDAAIVDKVIGGV